MATIGMSYLVLEDNWPGAPNPNLGMPTGGWDNTTDCCVSVPTYAPGTKIMAFNDCTRNKGYYTMAYLARADGSFALDVSGEAGNLAAPSVANLVCTHMDSTTVDGNETYVPWYFVSGDCTKSDTTTGGLGCVAIQCGSMNSEDGTNDAFDYGWFWVGGVCPGNAAGDLTWLYDCSMTTGGSVAKGVPIFLVDDGTNGIEFDGILDGTYETERVGWAIKTDA